MDGRPRGASVEVDVAANLPPVRLDAEMFRRAAANLLGNAVKFSPKGGTVRVEARDRRRGRHGASCASRVSDDGPGFPAAGEVADRDALPPVPGLGDRARHRASASPSSRRSCGPTAAGSTSRTTSGPGSTFTLWIPA